MHSPVNDETVMPEKAEADDAVVANEVETIELEAVDAATDEIEETDNGEVTAEAQEEVEATESSTEKEVPKERIDEVTKARREAERERDYYKNLHEQREKQVAQEPVESGKTLADFEYDEGKFTEYLTGQAKAAAAAETTQETQREQGARLQADFQGRESDFASGVDDYHKAVYEDTHKFEFSRDMVAATLHAEKGPELRYYLAKNPEVSAKLAKMGGYDMAIELGRIEATKLVKPKAASVTKAPAPVPKIAGTDSKSPLKIDDPKISDAQFRKMRERQIANR
jgi:hypothetical protein